MKIDDRVSNYMALLHGETAKPAVQAGDVAGAPAPAEAQDASTISTTAAQLADEEAHRERLNLIRRQLAEGSYNISGKDVAEKMLSVLKG